MIQKLRWKFVLINMLIVTAILSALCVVMVVTTRDSLRKDSLSLLYQVVTEDSTSRHPFFLPDSRQREDVSLPYFTVSVDRWGGTTVLDNQFGSVDEDTLVEVVETCMKEQPESGVLSEYQLRYLRVERGISWYIAFADTSQEESTLRSLTFNLLCITCGTIVVFFFISLALARWAVRPVERSWAQQRQFVSDASHELKTPLTVILSNVDMMESCGEGLDERQLRWLDNIRASSGQMRQLVEELLTLARSDNLAEKDRVREVFSFSELVMDCVLCFEPILYEAGKELQDDIADDLTVTGDPAKLRQLVDILLDNARKYADPDTVVSLRLHPEGQKRVLLSVTTQGNLIPPDQLERIFERFYREDKARTSEGFGLGLSIAARIAEEHEGKIWAESSPDTGNTFLFSMPRGK
jgi:signal transduction histidine kinase